MDNLRVSTDVTSYQELNTAVKVTRDLTVSPEVRVDTNDSSGSKLDKIVSAPDSNALATFMYLQCREGATKTDI